MKKEYRKGDMVICIDEGTDFDGTVAKVTEVRKDRHKKLGTLYTVKNEFGERVLWEDEMKPATKLELALK